MLNIGTLGASLDFTKYQFAINFCYSNHELGVYDNPSFIDFVLNTTGQEDLYFVGHSQGTTTYFIMTSERPEYNQKIRLSIMWAPVTYTSNIFNPIARLAGDFISIDRVSMYVLSFKM